MYAYALLFPGSEHDVELDPSDPRLRLAYDLYNLGLAEGLRRPDGAPEVELVPSVWPLPFGWLRLDVDPAGFEWLGYRLERFVPSATLTVRGLRNRYRQPGIGAVARRGPGATGGRGGDHGPRDASGRAPACP